MALAIDTHDREVTACIIATDAAVSGEMVRNMMLGWVERRFDARNAPQLVQWLATDGSAYTAG